MALIRFRPLSQELSVTGATCMPGEPSLDGFSASRLRPSGWAPAADMYETKNDVVVTAECQGSSDETFIFSWPTTC